MKKIARKTLEDFNNDYQAYADYLESAECANDEGYTIYADEKGNEYEAIDGDWTKGHSHKKENSNWQGRSLDDPKSKGRPWSNKWKKYNEFERFVNDEPYEEGVITKEYDYKRDGIRKYHYPDYTPTIAREYEEEYNYKDDQEKNYTLNKRK